MDKPILSNPEIFPNDQELTRHLKETKYIWDDFLTTISSDHPDFDVTWKYYKDGGNWLCKVQRKTKTICWISIWEGIFKVTFYFGDKAESMLIRSALAAEYLKQYLNGKRYGKIRAITIDVTLQDHLTPIYQLIEVKLKLK